MNRTAHFYRTILFVVLSLFAAGNSFAQTNAPANIAAQLLNDKTSAAERDALIATSAGKAAEIVAALVKDLQPGTPEEYKRIPSIWRVSIAAGKLNNADELKSLLYVSLPTMNEPLRDWQAVVIGGGIINGLTQVDVWPRPRIADILKNDKSLASRWQRSIELASLMSDDPRIKNGTRYDALRMLGVIDWDKSGTQLTKYLAKGINAELQQGAICAAGDIQSKKVAPALLANFDHFSDSNKNFVLDLLLRDSSRAYALLDAVEKKQLNRSALGVGRVEKLKNFPDKKIQQRAQKLFADNSIKNSAAGAIYSVGIAKIDITPDYPIRLNGYLARTNESEGVLQHIFAKALAIGTDKEGPAILISLDNCIIPAQLRGEVLSRLAKYGVTSEKFAICTSHTHSAPKLAGAADNIFGMDIPLDQQARIDRYTKEVVENLTKVAVAALKDRKPSKLSWGQTKASFAANRRTKGGPVDHDLPVLKITGKDGKLRGLLVNYACHCTTLGHQPNKICGDWAGYAQEYLEQKFPGIIAMTVVGCGADSNPSPRGGEDGGVGFAKQHGQSITTAASDLLSSGLTPLTGKLEGHVKIISLPLDKLPTRQEWEERAKKNDPNGYQARKNLARLDRGEKLPTEIPYLVQTWNFGNELAMVFLPGEVVVDYSLRLKKEFDASRLWVNGYANEVPCYIPSKRIWREGGYEGGAAMVYYDKPARLAENTEDQIIATVHELMPKDFFFDEKKAEFPPAKSVEDALVSFHLQPGFTVDAVASEPLIVDPVAIDFTTDGKLLVCEMHDYPNGMDGNFKVPGGRIKMLEDKNHDGKFDAATTFLDKLTFPTGVMQWRKGVLICTAPDILYAEDTNGDGKADIVKKLFSGFATHNFQARVNSLRWGLDNWVYGSGGLFGGKIHSEITGQDYECSGRDFRLNPDTGEFETAGGISQQGRVRDDFGNWFGCDNSTFLWHFPLPEKYVRRNSFVAAPEPRLFAIRDVEPNVLFPVSRTLERFNNPNSANRTTSAAGLEIYRDELLGKNFYNNAFIGETVHNLVQRFVVTPEGITFGGRRAAEEQRSEFLASTDNWFRPVETRTGPDGALWVVDMYRFVIEHPKWIPAERLAKLDVRAGDDKGRVYRVYPTGTKLKPLKNLTAMSASQLVNELSLSNGMERDLAHRELFQRGDLKAVPPLQKLAASARNPAIKVQVLSALEGLKSLNAEMILSALNDENHFVRENAIRLSEPFLRAGESKVGEALLKLANDSEIRVRYQLALTLGEWNDPRAGTALGEIAKNNSGDSWMRSAVLSSAKQFPGQIFKSILTLAPESVGRAEMVNALIATAAGSDDPNVFESILIAIAPAANKSAAVWQLAALSSVQEALQRKKLTLDSFAGANDSPASVAVRQIEIAVESAADIAKNKSVALADRQAAIRLLSWSHNDASLQLLIALATGTENAKVQKVAQDSLRLQRNPKLPEMLIGGWPKFPVSVRGSVLEILLSREEGLEKVFTAIEKGIITPAEIPLGNRQLLLKHADANIQKRAVALFPQNENRQAVLGKFSAEVPKLIGSPDRGAEVFGRACANCHSFRGQGFAVGPDLMPLGDKSIQDFLLAILDPSSVIEPRFIQYNIETKDGRSLSGVIQAETASSVTLVQGGGVREKILRSDISEMKASGFSLMPEGLEEGTSAQDFTDLIAYLKMRPTAFGSATAIQAAEAKQKFVTAGATGFSRLISASEQLPYPSWLGVLPLAHCRQTDGNGQIAWETTPAPLSLQPAEFYHFRVPVGFGLLSASAGKFILKLNGKAVLDFNVTLADALWKSGDGKVTMLYQVMENNTEDSNGILTINIRGDLLESGKAAALEVVGSKADSQRWFGIYLIAGK